MEQAWEMARLLASGPPLVYAAVKEVVREARRGKDTQINTIGLLKPQQAGGLKDIAKGTKGKFKLVTD